MSLRVIFFIWIVFIVCLFFLIPALNKTDEKETENKAEFVARLQSKNLDYEIFIIKNSKINCLVGIATKSEFSVPVPLGCR